MATRSCVGCKRWLPGMALEPHSRCDLVGPPCAQLMTGVFQAFVKGAEKRSAKEKKRSKSSGSSSEKCSRRGVATNHWFPLLLDFACGQSLGSSYVVVSPSATSPSPLPWFSGEALSSCVVTLQRLFRAQGFSCKAAKFMSRPSKRLSVSAIRGYHCALAPVLRQSGIDLSTDTDLSSLFHSFVVSFPSRLPRLPTWDLSLVLRSLSRLPYEPLRTASLRGVSLKTVFLLALTSAHRGGRGRLPSLSVQVVCEYLRRTRDCRPACSRLLVTVSDPSRAVHPHTLSKWICQVIQTAYASVSEEESRLLKVNTHEVRAIVFSLEKLRVLVDFLC
ncbi:hypothetical protein E2C01_056422 [Portunus trituberculatus]|uniref:Uncharacterized protein n=1 Tax=Portunus trituberculatus TaxID=210409 RepID=A0A5B7GZK4_PORTR|nr:hypothetical protein [Portunus trituberculatus]